MKIIFKILICLFLIFGFAKFAKADDSEIDHLVISEVFYDTLGTDADEEWIEIYNPTDEPVDVSEYKIGDEETKGDTEGMFQFLNGAFIEAEDFIVIALKSEGFQKLYNFKPNFEFLESDPTIFNLIKYSNWSTGNISLSNNGDQVLLLDNDDNLVDAVVWGGTSLIWKINGGQEIEIKSHPGVQTSYSLSRDLEIEDSDDCAIDFFENNPHPELSLNLRPVAIFDINGNKIIGENLIFDATRSVDFDGDQLNYSWIFKDSMTQVEEIRQGKIVSYSFPKIGTFEISLSVDDGQLENTNSEQIYISYDFRKIILNEILPNPIGPDSGNEFIEIYNSGNFDLDLTGWLIKDKSDNYKKLNGTLKPKEYLPIYNSVSLNNDGDEIFLYFQDELIDETEYSGPMVEGLAWARDLKGNWLWTQTPTPGKINKITSPENDSSKVQSLDIASLKKLKKGSLVFTVGIVTATPGKFSKYYFYIQDELAGIQIYFSKGNFPKLKIGDKITVLGELSESEGEKRIKISKPENIKIVDFADFPQPKNIKINQAKNFVGFLVKISGKITKLSGSTIYLNDDTGEIRIYISSLSGIKRPKLQKGDQLEISGIISQTKSGFRILPRLAEDLKIISQNKAEKTKTKKSALENILGADGSKAAAVDSNLGQDFRPKTAGAKFWTGLSLILFGLLFFGLWGIFYWRKNVK